MALYNIYNHAYGLRLPNPTDPLRRQGVDVHAAASGRVLQAPDQGVPFQREGLCKGLGNQRALVNKTSGDFSLEALMVAIRIQAFQSGLGLASPWVCFVLCGAAPPPNIRKFFPSQFLQPAQQVSSSLAAVTAFKNQLNL